MTLICCMPILASPLVKIGERTNVVGALRAPVKLGGQPKRTPRAFALLLDLPFGEVLAWPIALELLHLLLLKPA
jgi:hypothetical protein